MHYYIYRNHTVEPFFKAGEATFSGYEDISEPLQSEEVCIWFYLPNYKENSRIVAQEIEHYFKLFELVFKKIPQTQQVYAFTMYNLFSPRYLMSDFSLDRAIDCYNAQLIDFSQAHSNLKLINISDFFKDYSSGELLNWKYYYMTQAPFNPLLAKPFQAWFTKQTDAIQMKRKKCLVLDLDNTLWGGVLGEDGVNGIQLGEAYPGVCYLDFQRYILELSRNGVMLAACSKNNEQDVLEAWGENPYMVLNRDSFVAYRINWENKVENIESLANELNIGLDSMVFVDDNPTERALVKQFLPMVEAPDFPIHPYDLPVFAKQLIDTYFKAYSLTSEDMNKTLQYKENALRANYGMHFADVDEYLKSLAIELHMELLSESNVARLAQMTQKTNQFNLTTFRYSESDLVQIVQKGGVAYGMRVKDKFGDYGLTGLMIISGLYSENPEIDTLLLSCRILGKRIENEFVNYVLSELKKQGVRVLYAQYIKSQKNAQVSEFYDKLCFEPIRVDGENKRYEVNLLNIDTSPSGLFTITI